MQRDLCPELDKLRNKEKSFGCVVKISGWPQLYIGQQGLNANRDEPYEVTEKEIIQYEIMSFPYVHKAVKYTDDFENTIGHPLTWGRICQLFEDHYGIGRAKKELAETDYISSFYEVRGGIGVVMAVNKLYEQNELQRMQSPHREDLKALLVKFAEYL